MFSRAAFLTKLAATSAWALLPNIGSANAENETSAAANIDLAKVSSGADRHTQIDRLVRAYPEQGLRGLDSAIAWPDGTVTPLNDARDKTFEEALAAPELVDQLRVPYPKGRDYQLPEKPNGDPGRIRYQPFFLKMYGADPITVASRLAEVEWLPSPHSPRIRITRVNGIDRKLQKVAEEIARLPAERRQAAARLGGTFNWRSVQGTTRLSPHSYGIAIDLDPPLGNYWRWSRSRSGDWRQRDRISLEIVEIFENWGFIWGGKWYHFDTIHFEYRPELLS